MNPSPGNPAWRCARVIICQPIGETHDLDRPPLASDRPGRRSGGLQLRRAMPSTRCPTPVSSALPRPSTTSRSLRPAGARQVGEREHPRLRHPCRRRAYGGRPVPQQVALRSRRLLRARSQRPAQCAADAAAASMRCKAPSSTPPMPTPSSPSRPMRSSQFGAFSQNGGNGAAAPLRAGRSCPQAVQRMHALTVRPPARRRPRRT